MAPRWGIAPVAFSAMLVLGGCGGAETDPAGPSEPAMNDRTTGPVPEPEGLIAFNRGEGGTENIAVYTIKPDGSDEQRLIGEHERIGPGHSENGRWSPDGTEIHIFCCGDGMIAHFLDPSTGDLRVLEPPDPALELYCGGAWSPDGERVACEAYGGLNGIHTVRAADGGDLERITSISTGYDSPGDFSPDGDRIVFVRVPDDGSAKIMVTNVDGSGLHRISPSEVFVDDIFGGSWSPDGSRILFVARESEDHHKAIWVVNEDGTSPHQLRIEGPCGGPLSDPGSFGCYSPSWSPDGTMIVFARSTPDPSVPEGFHENIYIVNADGTGLFQVTDGGLDDNPDWGTPPGTS